MHTGTVHVAKWVLKRPDTFGWQGFLWRPWLRRQDAPATRSHANKSQLAISIPHTVAHTPDCWMSE